MGVIEEKGTLMRTMVNKAAGPVMIVIGLTLAVWMGNQVASGQDAIVANQAILSWCNTGGHWCSGSFTGDLTSQNGIIGMFSAFWFMFMIISLSVLIGGMIVTWTEQEAQA